MGHSGVVYVGAAMVGAWGVAHALPVRRVVAGFEPLTDDNRHVLTMVWIAEALSLVFIGVVAALAAASAMAGDRPARSVCSACAGMLIVSAAWTRVTGGRTKNLAMRLCPLVKTVAAALIWLGAWS
jgi:hypothetical protein